MVLYCKIFSQPPPNKMYSPNYVCRLQNTCALLWHMYLTWNYLSLTYLLIICPLLTLLGIICPWFWFYGTLKLFSKNILKFLFRVNHNLLWYYYYFLATAVNLLKTCKIFCRQFNSCHHHHYVSAIFPESVAYPYFYMKRFILLIFIDPLHPEAI